MGVHVCISSCGHVMCVVYAYIHTCVFVCVRGWE